MKTIKISEKRMNGIKELQSVPFADGGIYDDTKFKFAVNITGGRSVFTTGSDNKLWHKYQLYENGAWSDWICWDKIVQEFEVITNFDGSIMVFARGTDNKIYIRFELPLRGELCWSGWQLFTDVDSVGKIVAVKDIIGIIHVFTHNHARELLHNRQYMPNGLFGEMENLGGVTDMNDFQVAMGKDGKLYVICIAQDFTVWIKTSDEHYNWKPWTWVYRGIERVHNVGVTWNGNFELQLFAIGKEDSRVYYRSTKTNTSEWDDPQCSEWKNIDRSECVKDILPVRGSSGKEYLFAIATDGRFLVAHEDNANSGKWGGFACYRGSIRNFEVAQNLDGTFVVIGIDTSGYVKRLVQQGVDGNFGDSNSWVYFLDSNGNKVTALDVQVDYDVLVHCNRIFCVTDVNGDMILSKQAGENSTSWGPLTAI